MNVIIFYFFTANDETLHTTYTIQSISSLFSKEKAWQTLNLLMYLSNWMRNKVAQRMKRMMFAISNLPHPRELRELAMKKGTK